jgi:diguanylate cyclase (GGDEF)-like protein
MTKILVIEDDATVRTLILKLLKVEGFDVISSENGRMGVQMAQSDAPDLIICDVMMPESNGYEVLDQLRQDPATARIPFIFLSAKADRTDLRQGMELGADDYLTKPFRRTELLGAIAARLTKQAAITQPYLDEMKRAAENLSQLAYRDPLTNLPNRIVFHHRLQEAVRQAAKSQRITAVVALNLNQFKQINAHFGYAEGDALLQAFGDRLRNCDLGCESFAARLGGDEFSLLLSNISHRSVLVSAAQTLQHHLVGPYQLDGQSVRVQTSIGIALYPDDSNTPDNLLTRADTAMRYAKAQQSQVCQFYGSEMDEDVLERQQIHARLLRALDRQEFQVYYQPQVNLITGRIIGVEALLRWHQADMGLVQPERFIAIAEETSLIISLGEWVLRTACKQAKAWQSLCQVPIRMSVNLSARQFRQPNLTETVAQIFQETGLNPDHLVLELTETCVMENVDATIVILQQLQQMGVHIAIDDFGTGYSSLNYLKRFPIDALKIDQSFVREVTTDPNDAAIARAIIAMAQSLQLKVIAEGVETPEQCTFLRQSGCQAMQGYFFSCPVPASEIERMLAEDVRLQINPGRSA